MTGGGCFRKYLYRGSIQVSFSVSSQLPGQGLSRKVDIHIRPMRFSLIWPFTREPLHGID